MESRDIQECHEVDSLGVKTSGDLAREVVAYTVVVVLGDLWENFVVKRQRGDAGVKNLKGESSSEVCEKKPSLKEKGGVQGDVRRSWCLKTESSGNWGGGGRNGCGTVPTAKKRRDRTTLRQRSAGQASSVTQQGTKRQTPSGTEKKRCKEKKNSRHSGPRKESRVTKGAMTATATRRK